MGGPDGAELLGQREALLADMVDGQFVAEHRVVDLGDHGVEQSGDGRDQDERADEDAGVEVQSQQQRAEPA
jgi:hypothetical protein